MPYTPDDLIPISALQHALFCPRQYALIHLEQLWAENRFTAEGEVLHERVHREHHESRRTFREEYGMPVHSLEWGLTGKCDLVELWLDGAGGVKKVSPVEFKRGHEKESDVDRVQLCAQVLCLEEMFCIDIAGGQLYYFKDHRRKEVDAGAELREKTGALICKIRDIIESGQTPLADYQKRKCDNCSLVDLCMPKNTGVKAKQVARYIRSQIALNENEFPMEDGNAQTT
jgi:CRISPR-associated exonuclease Cas4